jgi:hypothetical protein
MTWKTLIAATSLIFGLGMTAANAETDVFIYGAATATPWPDCWVDLSLDQTTA